MEFDYIDFGDYEHTFWRKFYDYFNTAHIYAFWTAFIANLYFFYRLYDAPRVHFNFRIVLVS